MLCQARLAAHFAHSVNFVVFLFWQDKIFMFFSNTRSYSTMSTEKALILFYTSVLLLFTIHWLSTIHIYKLDYAGGYAVKILFVKPDKHLLIGHNVFNDQKDYLPRFIDEKAVVVLSEKNFSHVISKNRYVMVAFYAPWCYWSQKLAPEYEKAATELKGEVVLANVDANKETNLTMKYEIQGYPTIYFFVGGVMMDDYYHERKRDAIVKWTRTKVDLGIYTITTTKQAELVLMAESKIVLGFFDSLQGLDSEELAAVSNLYGDIIFYQTTSADVAKMFQIDPEIKRPALFLLEKESHDLSHFNGPFTKCAIADFISLNQLPPVTTFTNENAFLILKSPMKQLWLFALAQDSVITSRFQEAAKAFKGKLLFIYVKMDGKGAGRRIAHDFGITGHAKRVPTIIAYMGNGSAKKYVMNDELSLSNIESFAENFMEDKLSSQSHTISETLLRLSSLQQ